MKGAPLTSLFRFLPHLFLQEMFIYCQLRVVDILLVYAPFGRNDRSKVFLAFENKTSEQKTFQSVR